MVKHLTMQGSWVRFPVQPYIFICISLYLFSSPIPTTYITVYQFGIRESSDSNPCFYYLLPTSNHKSRDKSHKCFGLVNFMNSFCTGSCIVLESVWFICLPERPANNIPVFHEYLLKFHVIMQKICIYLWKLHVFLVKVSCFDRKNYVFFKYKNEVSGLS